MMTGATERPLREPSPMLFGPQGSIPLVPGPPKGEDVVNGDGSEAHRHHDSRSRHDEDLRERAVPMDDIQKWMRSG